jgi:hypothetical protein
MVSHKIATRQTHATNTVTILLYIINLFNCIISQPQYNTASRYKTINNVLWKPGTVFCRVEVIIIYIYIYIYILSLKQLVTCDLCVDTMCALPKCGSVGTLTLQLSFLSAHQSTYRPTQQQLKHHSKPLPHSLLLCLLPRTKEKSPNKRYYI